MRHVEEPALTGGDWSPPDLHGRVALVTGASKGIGRGIAEVLARCGATVYVAARTAHGDSESVSAVVDAITEAGGQAWPAAVDLSDDDAVGRLVERIDAEAHRLDILVNNAVGWAAGGDEEQSYLYGQPWKAPLDWWDRNFDVGVRSHHVVSCLSAPLLTRRPNGLIVFTAERQATEPGMQELVMDLRGTVVARMAALWALHLRPLTAASVFLYPGFSRTESIWRAFESGTGYFDGWTRDRFMSETASVSYAGRAVAALAADGDVGEVSGQLVTSHEAAMRYDFTDTNGQRVDPI